MIKDIKKMNGNFHSAPRIEIMTNIFFACLTDHQSPAGQLRCAGQQYVDGASDQNVMTPADIFGAEFICCRGTGTRLRTST